MRFFDLVILEEVDRTYSRVAERERLEREESARERFRSLRARAGGQQDDSKTMIIAKDLSCVEPLVR